MSEELTAEQIKNYVKLDNQIHELELKNLRNAYEQLDGRLQSLKKEETDLKEKLKKKSEKTEKEKKDVDNLTQTMEQMVLSKGESNFTKELKKEEAEYMEALAEQDQVQKDLDKNAKDIKEAESKMPAAKAEVDKLNKLCQEQDQALNDIFKGSYGSDLENKLEADLDMLQEKKKRIDDAKYKWTNGHVLLQHAVHQLSTAVQCWGDMMKSSLPLERKFQEATKTRNNLIAATQNMRSTHNYLGNITFPYCKLAEIQTLEQAANNIYNDMWTDDRNDHANQCYVANQKRCAALLQWFDAVINAKIEVDLADVVQKYAEAEKHLRAERMRLIKELADKQHIAFDVDTSAFEMREVNKKDETQGMESPVGDQKQGKGKIPQQSNIAAIPSQEEIFGNMNDLKDEHQKRIEDHNKIVDMNKARVNQGLEEKLAARRLRRMELQKSS
ncbi:rho GTPase-activating protein gacV-like [Ylistrum balloti]|uniref:rho GTPase-activating protein gacV-like n=1 Tax=Ylistrum balloti TaxID=509963 RepID=UPI0029058320|nr:rho GTPase-activating protein gacV-like [Ylistrum balloti]